MARYRRFDTTPAGGVQIGSLAPPQLADVRARRAGLKSVMSNLELALAEPAPGRAVEWTIGVRDALRDVQEMWTRHILETEAPGAFLDELVTEAPRLATPATHLRREHSEILAIVVRAEKQLELAPLGDDTYEEWVDEMRLELTKLLVGLARHRQRGADLVFEAYHTDIGGGF